MGSEKGTVRREGECVEIKRGTVWRERGTVRGEKGSDDGKAHGVPTVEDLRTGRRAQWEGRGED